MDWCKPLILNNLLTSIHHARVSPNGQAFQTESVDLNVKVQRPRIVAQRVNHEDPEFAHGRSSLLVVPTISKRKESLQNERG